MTQADLLFSGSTPISRHCSRLGAEDAQQRSGAQMLRYLELLRTHTDGLTDYEAARLMGIERTSVNARRAPLVKRGVVVANGTVPGPTGIRNTRWALWKG